MVDTVISNIILHQFYCVFHMMGAQSTPTWTSVKFVFPQVIVTAVFTTNDCSSYSTCITKPTESCSFHGLISIYFLSRIVRVELAHLCIWMKFSAAFNPHSLFWFSCRKFCDKETLSSSSWNWCLINFNFNFNSSSDHCSEVMCMMFCEFGFKKDSNGCEICDCASPPGENDWGIPCHLKKNSYTQHHFPRLFLPEKSCANRLLELYLPAVFRGGFC